MKKDDDVKDDLTQLTRQVRMLQLAVLLLGAGWIVAATRGVPDVVRTHGVVIVDAQGRDRIILGSPTPRIGGRADALATTSVVFRSGDGKDRLILGEEPPPTINGKILPRIAPAWGLLWFNPAGDERGGVSYLDSGRSVVSLDRATGEGVYLTVNERSGFAGLVANYETSKAGEYAEALRIGTLGRSAFAQAANRDGTPAGALLAGEGGKVQERTIVQH